MKSPGWIAYMQSQEDKEKRQKELERKRAEAAAWKDTHLSNQKCPLCGSAMFLREGKYGQFYGCSRYPHCKGTRKIK